MTKPFRIRITDPTLWWDLLHSLDAGDCSAVRRSDGTYEVFHRQATSDRDARLELAFFLRAWESKHPHVVAELVG